MTCFSNNETGSNVVEDDGCVRHRLFSSVMLIRGAHCIEQDKLSRDDGALQTEKNYPN